jgi:hypothetical protein
VAETSLARNTRVQEVGRARTRVCGSQVLVVVVRILVPGHRSRPMEPRLQCGEVSMCQVLQNQEDQIHRHCCQGGQWQ